MSIYGKAILESTELINERSLIGLSKDEKEFKEKIKEILKSTKIKLKDAKNVRDQEYDEQSLKVVYNAIKNLLGQSFSCSSMIKTRGETYLNEIEFRGIYKNSIVSTMINFSNRGANVAYLLAYEFISISDLNYPVEIVKDINKYINNKYIIASYKKKKIQLIKGDGTLISTNDLDAIKKILEKYGYMIDKEGKLSGNYVIKKID